MGNCVFGGGGGDGELREQVEQMIKVVTSTGGMMELYAPITAGCVTDEFPGHELFSGNRSLFPYENLHVGLLYHLIPISSSSSVTTTAATSAITPYRMSNIVSQARVGLKSSSEMSGGMMRRSEQPYSSSTNGVWKVRLVIDPEQLSEILSQEARTGELIESMRTVARCGGRKSCSTGDSGGRGGLGWSNWKGSAAL